MESSAEYGPRGAARVKTLEATLDAIRHVLEGGARAWLRSFRQTAVLSWVRDTFGPEVLTPNERVMRFLEEAIELAQAQGLAEIHAAALVAHVYSKPKGDLWQEVGGVGVTLLAYCESVGIDADKAEMDEFARVLLIDPAKFRARHNTKADKGLALPIKD